MPAQCFSTIMKDRNQMQGAKVVSGGLRDTASEIFFRIAREQRMPKCGDRPEDMN